MNSIIISGARGYFGSYAAAFFERQGYRVLKASRDIESDIIFDSESLEEFASTCLSENIDVFMHSAAANEVMTREKPYESVYLNVAGTKAALDFCVRNNIRKFVYISTFHVYGNIKGYIDETIVPIPMNDYGITHLCAEEYVKMYGRERKIDTVVVRPSNMYGVPTDIKRCNRWTLIPLEFCLQALRTRKIVLKTPGFQKRNFISMEDVCSSIEYIINANDKISLVNLCGNETLSIREFAFLVKNVIKEAFDIEISVEVPESEYIIEAELMFSSKYKELENTRMRLTDYIKEMYSILATEFNYL